MNRLPKFIQLKMAIDHQDVMKAWQVLRSTKSNQIPFGYISTFEASSVLELLVQSNQLNENVPASDRSLAIDNLLSLDLKVDTWDKKCFELLTEFYFKHPFDSVKAKNVYQEIVKTHYRDSSPDLRANALCVLIRSGSLQLATKYLTRYKPNDQWDHHVLEALLDQKDYDSFTKTYESIRSVKKRAISHLNSILLQSRGSLKNESLLVEAWDRTLKYSPISLSTQLSAARAFLECENEMKATEILKEAEASHGENQPDILAFKIEMFIYKKDVESILSVIQQLPQLSMVTGLHLVKFIGTIESIQDSSVLLSLLKNQDEVKKIYSSLIPSYYALGDYKSISTLFMASNDSDYLSSKEWQYCILSMAKSTSVEASLDLVKLAISRGIDNINGICCNLLSLVEQNSELAIKIQNLQNSTDKVNKLEYSEDDQVQTENTLADVVKLSQMRS